MAKIDVSTIDGYADMTAEEKLAALEAFEFDDHSSELADLEKYKDATTKATKEASEYKKQLKALQDQTAKLCPLDQHIRAILHAHVPIDAAIHLFQGQQNA